MAIRKWCVKLAVEPAHRRIVISALRRTIGAPANRRVYASVPIRHAAFCAVRAVHRANFALVPLALRRSGRSPLRPLALMHGPAELTSATLWIRDRIRGDRRGRLAARGQKPRSVASSSSPRYAADNVVVARLTGLRPGATAEYRASNRCADSRSGTLPARSRAWPRGRCRARHHDRVSAPVSSRRPRPAMAGQRLRRRLGIFDAIAATNPDVMLWLGDNLYLQQPDLYDPASMAARYRRQRGISRRCKGRCTSTSHLASSGTTTITVPTTPIPRTC